MMKTDFDSTMRRITAAILVCILNLFVTIQSYAGIIAYAGGAAQPGLYSINAATGTALLETGVDPFTFSGGLGYLNGIFYISSHSSNPGGAPFSYGTLDPSTGHIVPVGLQNSNNWYGLAGNSAGGFLYVLDADTETLKSVVPGGAVIDIGPIVIANPSWLQGLAYDNTHGVLYATSYYSGTAALYTINTSTGSATLVGSLGLPETTFGGGIPLAYDEINQVLYAATSEVSVNPGSFYSVNVQTGELTRIGLLGIPAGSMAWYPDGQTGPLAAVPEPPAMTLVGLAGLFVAFCVYFRHRQGPVVARN